MFNWKWYVTWESSPFDLHTIRVDNTKIGYRIFFLSINFIFYSLLSFVHGGLFQKNKKQKINKETLCHSSTIICTHLLLPRGKEKKKMSLCEITCIAFKSVEWYWIYIIGVVKDGIVPSIDWRFVIVCFFFARSNNSFSFTT